MKNNINRNKLKQQYTPDEGDSGSSSTVSQLDPINGIAKRYKLRVVKMLRLMEHATRATCWQLGDAASSAPR